MMKKETSGKADLDCGNTSMCNEKQHIIQKVH